MKVTHKVKRFKRRVHNMTGLFNEAKVNDNATINDGKVPDKSN